MKTIDLTSAAVRSAERTAERMSDVGVQAVRCSVAVLINGKWRMARTGEIVPTGANIRFGLDGDPVEAAVK